MNLRIAILAAGVAFSIFDFRFAIGNPTTAPASTQQSSTQPSSVMQQSFADLASSDARKREDARVDLMGLKRDDLPALRELVKEKLPLAPAQETALQEIVAQIYLAGIETNSDMPGGFLGLHDVSEDRIVAQGDGGLEGVLIQTRLVGFCGYRFLQEGDVIQRVEEPESKPIASFSELRQTIGGLGTGQTITLAVLRHGETRSITIPLDGRPSELPQVGLPGALENYVEYRNELADEYWRKNFAPLLEKSVL